MYGGVGGRGPRGLPLSRFPKESRELFVRDSAKLLAECLSFNRIRIFEMDQFDNWMKRLTRNGPESVMISFRGSESKRITSAMNINFEKSENRQQIYLLLFALTGGLIGSTGSIPISVFWTAAVAGEAFLYEKLKSKMFKKGFSWQKSVANGLREIKPFGTIGKNGKERLKIAYKEIERILEFRQ